MKKAVIGVLLIVLALVMGITSLKIIDKSCDELTERLDALKSAAESGTKEELNRESVLLNSLWERKKLFFTFFQIIRLQASLKRI